MKIGLYILVLILVCIFLNIFCDKLGEHLEDISSDINMDRDVAGATFLAISSSVPELLTSFISIVFLGKFEEVGFATIAGSGIFNVLLIPMFAVLVYKGKTIDFDKKIGRRDIGFYISSIAILAISMYLGEFSWITGLFLCLNYLFYLRCLVRGQKEPIKWKMAKRSNIIGSIIYLIPIAISIKIAIEAALKLSNLLGISGFVISIIVLAAVTSIPDLLLSIAEAKKGEIESATANAIGSNIFDICICLGLPLVITLSHVPTNFMDNIGVLGFLVLSVAATAWMLFTGAKKWKTMPMFAVYAAFIYYISLM